jgi:acyl-CoA thioesterase II
LVADIDSGLFRGHRLYTPDGGRGAFGGQIIAQALWAACQTVPESEELKTAHSFHCYFLLPGDSSRPAIYSVSDLRDGRSFASRGVTATQGGKAILAGIASFHRASEPTTLEHQDPMPEAPLPETLPDVSAAVDAVCHCAIVCLSQARARWQMVLEDPRLPEHLRPYVELQTTRRSPIDIRFCESVRSFDRVGQPAERRAWFRARDAIDRSAMTDRESRILDQCIIAYASDMPLLSTSLLPHGLTPLHMGMMASLDHTVWWHAPARADEWLLFVSYSPRLVHGRALCFGHIFSSDGTLVASVAQEGLVRTRSSKL